MSSTISNIDVNINSCCLIILPFVHIQQKKRVEQSKQEVDPREKSPMFYSNILDQLAIKFSRKIKKSFFCSSLVI